MCQVQICSRKGDSKVLIAILVMTALNAINTFLIILVLLAFYGKVNEVIEKQETKDRALLDFLKGLIEGLKIKK